MLIPWPWKNSAAPEVIALVKNVFVEEQKIVSLRSMQKGNVHKFKTVL